MSRNIAPVREIFSLDLVSCFIEELRSKFSVGKVLSSGQLLSTVFDLLFVALSAEHSHLFFYRSLDSQGAMLDL